jgi:hypothetical protein
MHTKWVEYIKMNLEELGRERVDWIQDRDHCGFLGFHERQGIS